MKPGSLSSLLLDGLPYQAIKEGAFLDSLLLAGALGRVPFIPPRPQAPAAAEGQLLCPGSCFAPAISGRSCPDSCPSCSLLAAWPEVCSVYSLLLGSEHMGSNLGSPQGGDPCSFALLTSPGPEADCFTGYQPEYRISLTETAAPLRVGAGSALGTRSGGEQTNTAPFCAL